MANLWSHYLSKRAVLHSLLVLFMWSRRQLVSAHSWKRVSAGSACVRNKCTGLIDVCATPSTELAQFAFCSGPCLLP